MRKESSIDRLNRIFSVLIWGALWGIFEATAGYLLHTVSFGYSWLIWYPAACFFMANVYRNTRRISSICYVGLLCAAVKLFNLLLPGRIDRVLNPAVSILAEALAMAAVVFAVNRFAVRENTFVKALWALATNTGWRVLYILYLLFFVPAWIRDISVIGSRDLFISFFIMQNLITSAIIYIGYQLKTFILKPPDLLEHRYSIGLDLSSRSAAVLKTGIAALLLCTNIALQMVLK